MMQRVLALALFIVGLSIAQNPNCALIVPPNPLSAIGLATPYELTAAVAGAGACNQANTLQASFVQGTIIDTVTGILTVYNPLVTDTKVAPLVAPVVPILPANFEIGLWFGTNAGTLTLLDNGGSLVAGNCVNGAGGADLFGQFAYCNAVAFFAAANTLIAAGTLAVPPKGTGLDGLPCLTVRDFALVDMDQSDNVVTSYLVSGAKTAHNSDANRANIPGATVLTNGSDNRLLAVAMAGALACTPWQVSDLTNPGHLLPSLGLNELHATYTQLTVNGIPPAIIPVNDPMTTINGLPNLKKLNLYRAGVGQIAAASLADPNANTKSYCQHLVAIAPKRIFIDRQFTVVRPPPDPAVATNLFGFLMNRLFNTLSAGGLNCTGLVPIVQPLITFTMDANGVVTDAAFNFPAIGQVAPIVVPTVVPTQPSQIPLFSAPPAPPTTPKADAGSLAVQTILVLFALACLL